jgi:hypothetical protein
VVVVVATAQIAMATGTSPRMVSVLRDMNVLLSRGIRLTDGVLVVALRSVKRANLDNG